MCKFCKLSKYKTYKILYLSYYVRKFTKLRYILGTHELSVEFGGQLVPGSPLVTEIVDPSKILLEGMKRGKVGEPVVVDGKLCVHNSMQYDFAVSAYSVLMYIGVVSR